MATPNRPDFRELTLAAQPDDPHADPNTLHQMLPTYYEPPIGCGVHVAPDDRMAPLIDFGDKVVVDFTDRTFTPGEIYLLMNGERPNLWQVVYEPRVRAEHMGRAYGDCVWMHPINRPGSKTDSIVGCANADRYTPATARCKRSVCRKRCSAR